MNLKKKRIFVKNRYKVIGVEIELHDEKYLTIHGNIGNNCFGQCEDEINELLQGNEERNKIYRWWKLYHLNDMHAGTRKQEKWLKDNGIDNRANDYTNVCNIMKENNIYIDDGYAFGTGWLQRDIPEDDLNEIKEYLNTK